MTKPKFIYFSADQQFIISFIRIKNLIKTLLTLKPKLPISTPKIQEPILSGSYMWVFTVLFQRKNKGLLLVYSLSTICVFTFHSLLNICHRGQANCNNKNSPFLVSCS